MKKMQKGGEAKSTNKGGSGKAADKKASASEYKKPKAKYGSAVSYKKGGAKK